jgi:acyl-CoA synthetase (AMP-forming)/AMP-acid ligase II
LILLGVVLGRTLYVTERFQAARACTLIATHRISAVIVVPLMLQRMLNHDSRALESLRCIICGSAPLSPTLATATLTQLGPILFNLYGSSEAGFSLLATPELLGRKPDFIGQPIQGVQAKVVDQRGAVVPSAVIGELQIRSAWSAGRQWVATGDLACQDADGDFRLCGRVDEMIVSGGENVYPVEVEAILAAHPAVEAVAVVGVPDADFGQRLQAFIVCRPHTALNETLDEELDEATLLAWLKPKVARYQVPAKICFRSALPYTALGKVNRRAL